MDVLGRSGVRDTGHYNCRDYHISIDHVRDATQELTFMRRPQSSFASPINRPVRRQQTFAFFRLPLELRQKIYSFLSPTTCSARTRRCSPSTLDGRPQPVIWQRGQTSLFCVCKRMHDECAAIVYGSNMFTIFVDYTTITFRLQWLLASGLTPRKDMDLLSSFRQGYLRLMRQVTIIVEHPDSYMGMIKYNIGGKGLTYGVKKQVELLVSKLQDRGGSLNVLRVRLTTGDERLDHLHLHGHGSNHELVRCREMQLVLDPLRSLKGVGSVQIGGVVGDDYAEGLMRHVGDETCDEA